MDKNIDYVLELLDQNRVKYVRKRTDAFNDLMQSRMHYYSANLIKVSGVYVLKASTDRYDFVWLIQESTGVSRKVKGPRFKGHLSRTKALWAIDALSIPERSGACFGKVPLLVDNQQMHIFSLQDAFYVQSASATYALSYTDNVWYKRVGEFLEKEVELTWQERRLIEKIECSIFPNPNFLARIENEYSEDRRSERENGWL